MLICILTKNVITSCSVTMMLFLHLEVKPLMTLTTVLFFQAEDGIRDHCVTGVQTCALPICDIPRSVSRRAVPARFAVHLLHIVRAAPRRDQPRVFRSEERRVGKECRYQGGEYFMKKNNDVIASLGGKTSYDADKRTILEIRY